RLRKSPSSAQAAPVTRRWSGRRLQSSPMSSGAEKRNRARPMHPLTSRKKSPALLSSRGSVSTNRNNAASGGFSFAAEAEFLGKFRTAFRICRRDHRIIRWQVPLRPVFLRRHVVIGAQIALQHFELFSILQA